ncbi:protein phosphatase [Bifidobacterium margollesii]|uniref:Protein phosphatase n=1 Tax=Bifidobacterium margollesii TaxID=2020964 RepID=A0A2N5JCX2_9BIFI|nr:serine/threonine-protein phosphatase [Bifidobacterium margollesii]PLS32064.1 protein phosphatase [Bifidobacterium margollesii]
MTTYTVTAAATSDIGLRRRMNQDCALTSDGMFLVFDGMGGGVAGEEASAAARRACARLAMTSERSKADIIRALGDAHRRVTEIGREYGGVSGTTVTGLILARATDAEETVEIPMTGSGSRPSVAFNALGDSFETSGDNVWYVVNIGDSRTYHLNRIMPLAHNTESARNRRAAIGDFGPTQHGDPAQHGDGDDHDPQGNRNRTTTWNAGSLVRITRDHSRRQELIDSGTLTPELAELTVPRNLITQCIGSPTGIDPDFFRADLPGRFIICSDGLHGEVDDDEIAAIAATSGTPRQTVDRLVDAALSHGGRDNVTVIVVDVIANHDDEDEEAENTKPDVDFRRRRFASNSRTDGKQNPAGDHDHTTGARVNDNRAGRRSAGDQDSLWGFIRIPRGEDLDTLDDDTLDTLRSVHRPANPDHTTNPDHTDPAPTTDHDHENHNHPDNHSDTDSDHHTKEAK